LEKKNKDTKAKQEVEKEKLLRKLEESATTVDLEKLEQTSLSLNEELVELKTNNEEIALLQAELQNSDQQKKKVVRLLRETRCIRDLLSFDLRGHDSNIAAIYG
jgi:hypothetical protein